MTDQSQSAITYRLMTLGDVDRVPIGCQGGREALVDRIRYLGSAAVLGFDGDEHVAQLQFRAYEPTLRSPDGLWDPLYWGDFGEYAPALPDDAIAVFCYHVGQLEDSEARDARYQGRGIGLAMLDFLLAWAEESKFSAVVAKCTPSPRSVMSFMGGQPASAYLARGFDLRASWVDTQLDAVVKDRGYVAADADPAEVAQVGCCVKTLR